MMRRIVTAIGSYCLILDCLLVVSLAMAPAAFSLPTGRHYEMVSPSYKAGYGVEVIEAAALNGESVAYTSRGSFAGAPANSIGAGSGSAYVATRGSSGWATRPLMVPASIAPYVAPAIADFSANFERAVFYGQRGASTGIGQVTGTEAEFLLHPIAESDFLANFVVGGEVINVLPDRSLNYTSASSDLSHIIFEVPAAGMPLTPEAAGATMEISQYDLTTNGAGEHTLRLVGVNNHLGAANQPEPQPIGSSCNVQLGSAGLGSGTLGSGTNTTSFGAVSSSGDEIFFHTCAGSPSSNQQLFVRLNGERTLEVSRPLVACFGEGNGFHGEVPCKGAAARATADFVGASQDGSKVFFTTTASLVGEDKDSTRDLYMATIGCLETEPECDVVHREVTGLQRIGSPVTPGESVGVQGVMAVSPDGTRVYFVAKGVLSSPGPDGAPVQGAENLYVYDTSSQSTAFIGDLCSKDGFSGEIADPQCPADLERPHGARPFANDERLWATEQPEAQLTHDGAFLVFASYARLTADDTDDARDVYRYDAVTETLERVSVGEAGSSAGNGEDEGLTENADASISSHPAVSEGKVVSQAELGTRAVTEDGSRIIFSTIEPLSAAATNGLLNAYEWHEGSVSIVSTGSDAQPTGQAEHFTITPSGSDVFFITVQKLLGQDTDDALDVYDARMGPGFPPVPGGVERCEGDGCQGPLSAPAPALAPGGTAVQPSGEEVSSKASAKKIKVTGRKHKYRHKRKRGAKKRRGRGKSSRGGRR